MVVATGLWSALAIGTVTRFGLVAGTAFHFAHALTIRLPLSTDFSAFYAGRSLLSVALVAVLAVAAWRVSTGDAGARRGLED